LNGDIKLIWLQLGIVNNDAKMIAEENGIEFIQDACIYVEHKAVR
jgi:predicted CoA-binding protein